MVSGLEGEGGCRDERLALMKGAAAELTPVDGPDIERFDAAFNPETGYGGVDICVPVE